MASFHATTILAFFGTTRLLNLWPPALRGDHRLTRVIRTLAQSILGRDDVRPVLWKLRDDGWIEIQRLRHHVYWTVRQPIGQRYFLKPVCSEDFHVFEICIAGVLDTPG